MNNFKKIALKIATPLSLAMYGLSAFAQTIPSIVPDSGIKDSAGLSGRAASILNSFIGLLGIIVVALIVFAGFLYATAGQNEKNTEKAKTLITYAMVGLAVAILSYAIANISFDFLNG